MTTSALPGTNLIQGLYKTSNEGINNTTPKVGRNVAETPPWNLREPTRESSREQRWKSVWAQATQLGSLLATFVWKK